jgi:hypothetical protein
MLYPGGQMLPVGHALHFLGAQQQLAAQQMQQITPAAQQMQQMMMMQQHQMVTLPEVVVAHYSQVQTQLVHSTLPAIHNQ